MLIPALDEELGLARVLAELPRAGVLPRSPAWVSGAGCPWRVRSLVVVDNGSTDGTAEVARRAGAIVVSEPRRGYGAACLAGLARLRLDPPAIVAFLDADASDDASELPALLAPLANGSADLAIGSRTLGEREPASLSPLQVWGNGLACALLRIGFGVRATDLGPFRAVRWEALERLHMRDRDYGWTVEMQARAALAGLRSVEVPVRYRARGAGRSKVSGTWRGRIGAGWKILSTIARVRLGG